MDIDISAMPRTYSNNILGASFNLDRIGTILGAMILSYRRVFFIFILFLAIVPG